MMAFAVVCDSATKVVTEIYLNCPHVHEALSTWIHLDLALDCLRPIAFHSKPLLLMVLLHGCWHRFFSDFEYAGEIRASDDSIQVCATRLRQKAGVGERGWSKVELCCEFDSAGREEFLVNSVHLDDPVGGRLPSPASAKAGVE